VANPRIDDGQRTEQNLLKPQILSRAWRLLGNSLSGDATYMYLDRARDSAMNCTWLASTSTASKLSWCALSDGGFHMKLKYDDDAAVSGVTNLPANCTDLLIVSRSDFTLCCVVVHADPERPTIRLQRSSGMQSQSGRHLPLQPRVRQLTSHHARYSSTSLA